MELKTRAKLMNRTTKKVWKWFDGEATTHQYEFHSNIINKNQEE
jgi:hypothetical protein